MNRLGLALIAILLMGGAATAQAKQAWIDFTGARVISQGLTQVNNGVGQEGETHIVRQSILSTAVFNFAKTGGTDAARYLNLRISPAFKANLKSVWVTVEYYDAGTGGFRLQYDANNSATAVGGPAVRYEFNSGLLLHQTWHISNFKLQGSQPGGSDIRIHDRAVDTTIDGPEYIARVKVTDYDPDFSYFPYAVQKPTIDGKVGSGTTRQA